ncbi:MAG: flagellar basal body P-ring formation chaperone FlgA [Pseudomonadota bacterium]
MNRLLLIAMIVVFAGPAAAESLIAAKNVRAGQRLQADDIVTPATTEALRVAASMIGKEAKRNLYKGKAFASGDVRSPTVIDRNALVTMTFTKGPLVIETEGKALDFGGVGDRIRVLNVRSKRIVSATVLDENRVRAN